MRSRYGSHYLVTSFNPHFVSIAFETSDSHVNTHVKSPFNPHFVSIAFETRKTPCGESNRNTFNPHFVSIAFETHLIVEWDSGIWTAFNPHFVSIAFETSTRLGLGKLTQRLSILIL